MRNKEFNGIWIPKEVLDIKDLTLTETFILSIVLSMQKCWASNSYLAEITNTSTASVSRAIKSLSEKQLIQIDHGSGSKRCLHPIIMISKPIKTISNPIKMISNNKIITNNKKIDNKINNINNTNIGFASRKDCNEWSGYHVGEPDF